MKRYSQWETAIEGICCLFLAGVTGWMTVSGQYLLFVTPRMKGYLYFSVVVLVLFSVSCFRMARVRRYKTHLKRFLVLVVPAAMMVVLPKDALQEGMQSASAMTLGTDMTAQGGGSENAEVMSVADKQADASTATDERAGQTDATAMTAETAGQADASAENAGQTDASTETAGQTETTTTTDTYDWEKKLPPGLDEENRTITVADEDFYDWVVQLCYYPDRYDGYTVHIHGTVYREDTMASDEFAVTRLLMTCCVADLSSFGPRCFLDDAQEIPVDTWVNVTGTYHYDTEKGMTITVTDWEAAEPASEPYIYPTY